MVVDCGDLQVLGGCGRIGFDALAAQDGDADVAAQEDAAPLCVSGDACPLEGLCYAGETNCEASVSCVATELNEAGSACLRGSCEADGVCLSGEGSSIRAGANSPAGVGFSIAVDGNRMVAGAWNPYNVGVGGSAVIFEHNGSEWAEAARLIPSDGAGNDGFGASVAVQGDTILVGARRRGASYEGAIYVFEKIGSAWEEIDIVVVPGIVNLGSAVAIDGDRAIATAHLGEINGGWGSGHVMERNPDKTWSVVATLTSPLADSLGWSAAIDGDRIVLGSLWTTTPDDTGSGAIHVYERQGASSWPEVATLYPPPPPMGGFWSAGSSVAVEGDRIVSGDQLATVENVDSGALAVWDLVDGSWNHSQTLVDSDPQEQSSLGRSVVLDGNRILASSTDYTNCEIRVSIFQRHNAEWKQMGRIAPEGSGCSDGQALEGHYIDLALALGDEHLFVGYPVSDGIHGAGSILDVSVQGY